MRGGGVGAHHACMTTTRTPLDAATAVLDDPALPAGDDERFVGFGVMGLPFGSGHYLALRQFPATSFSPGYRSVWHRDRDGVWTFYATTPGPQSCARYFGAATARDAVQCDIDVAWVTPWSLLVEIPGLLAWRIELRATVATRLMSAGPLLRAGRVRLCGTVPNGQRFMLAPAQVWAVHHSRAVLDGADLGPVGPLRRQARLAGFRPPQRGGFAVGGGHFENFDPGRHHAAPRTVAIG